MTKLVILLNIILLIVITGCKKGEEDPFFSLRSRENRLCGKWRVTEFEKTYHEGVDPHLWEALTYRLSSGQVHVFYRGSEVDKYAHSEEWEIKKDGSYSISSVIKNIPSKQVGDWSWNPKNKNDDFKTKQCVYFTSREYDYNNGEEHESYMGYSTTPSSIIVLDKLTYDLIKFRIEYETYIENSGYWRIQGTVTLERQEES